MKISLGLIDWTSISSIATVISILFLILNLREMRSQRIAMYKPKICIPDNNFYIGFSNTGIANIWTRQSDGKEIGMPPFYNIQILNIGLAAAIDVSIEWKIDLEKIRNDFDKLIESEESNVLKKEDDGVQYFYKYGKNNHYGFIIDNELENTTIPVIQKESIQEIRIPSIIYDYISYNSYEKFRILGYKRKEEKFPYKIGVRIEYFDIGNNKIVQEHEMKIDLIFYDKPFMQKNICIGQIKLVEEK